MSEQIIFSKGGSEAMSFFDELSKDTFSSKKAEGKNGSAKKARKASETGEHLSGSSGIVMNPSGKNADTEFGSDMDGHGQYGTQTYTHAGVSFDKISDSMARITYSGLLAKSGADRVIGVYGYGSNQRWEDVSEVVMSKDSKGAFTATIPIVSGKNVNFAFKDSAENWDNNFGLNYTFVN